MQQPKPRLSALEVSQQLGVAAGQVQAQEGLLEEVLAEVGTVAGGLAQLEVG